MWLAIQELFGQLKNWLHQQNVKVLDFFWFAWENKGNNFQKKNKFKKIIFLKTLQPLIPLKHVFKGYKLISSILTFC
jgi:hypothetical protein